MSIFRSLFKKKPSIEADDPVFGHITFERGIWTFIPSPPTEGFMINVDAPETGPSQLQRDFFQKIRSRLSDFGQLARDYMLSRVDEGVDLSHLSVYSVEIGSDDESRRESFVLEMSDDEAIVIHRVSFSGGTAVDYGYDD